MNNNIYYSLQVFKNNENIYDVCFEMKTSNKYSVHTLG